jgi:hypothetical protein
MDVAVVSLFIVSQDERPDDTGPDGICCELSDL